MKVIAYSKRFLVGRFVQRLRGVIENMVSAYRKDGAIASMEWVKIAMSEIAMMYTLGIINFDYERWLVDLVSKRYQMCACSSEHSH